MNGVFIWGMTIGSFLTGIFYVSLFMPLSYHSSIKMGLDPLDVILFVNIPSNLLETFSKSDLFSLQMRPILYALANLYGVCGIIIAFILVSVRTNKIITFTINVSGLAGGYFLTIYLAESLFKIIEIEEFIKSIFYIKIAYILLVYYLIEGGKNIIQKLGYKKYDIYFDGLYGIVSTIFLIKGFKESIAAALSGPIFLLSQFICTLIIEQTIGRFFYAIKVIGKKESNFKKSIPVGLKIKNILAGLWQGMKEYKSLEIEFIFPQSQMWSIIRQHKGSLLLFSSIVFIIFSGFPILAFIVYQLIMKGFIR